MFDFGWDEMALIAVVALVFLGPKELPQVMRTAGQWSRKMKSVAGEFRRHVDDMVREADLEEIREQARLAATGGVGGMLGHHIDPDGELKKAFDGVQAEQNALEGALIDASIPGPPPSAEPAAVHPPAGDTEAHEGAALMTGPAATETRLSEAHASVPHSAEPDPETPAPHPSAPAPAGGQ